MYGLQWNEEESPWVRRRKKSGEFAGMRALFRRSSMYLDEPPNGAISGKKRDLQMQKPPLSSCTPDIESWPFQRRRSDIEKSPKRKAIGAGVFGVSVEEAR
jgi:hypothetical protein